jgi:hypothetical protein
VNSATIALRARAVAKPNHSSTVLNPSNLGFHAHVFNNDDVVRLLKAAVEREGNQTAFAKAHGVNRAHLNMVLKGKRPVTDFIAGALGLHKVYIAQSQRRTRQKREARPLPS